MAKPKRYAISWVWTLPWDILAWLGVLLIWLFWGTKLHWQGGLWCELKPNSWPTRTWYRFKVNGKHVMNDVEDQIYKGRWKTWGGSTLGHGGFYGPGRSGGAGVDTEVEFHEHVHVEQFEVAMFFGLLMQLIFVVILLIKGQDPLWIVHGILWTMSWALTYGCAAVQAWFRGESGYKGSTMEEAAYALASEWERTKQGK